ncbi:MAG: N-acylglucosamine 2-epimerase [Spirochaetales bacterium]|jgi:N-acylglucosamine 2-epimerase|nr:N-acylglucosamine 2-epimerase [Spirochaetales bacterium]
METERLAALQEAFKDELTDNILPFWLEHGWDTKNGGIQTALGEDGELLDSDKSVWFQGRTAWTYATAYRIIKEDAQYLEMAKSCLDFIEEYCVDSDGRYLFRVTAEGKPVIKRLRYIFSEAFAVLGMAAYSRASGDLRYAQKAEALFEQIQRTLKDPDALVPKFNPEIRSSTGLAVPMILLVVAQELREAVTERAEYYNVLIDGFINTILTTFVDRERKAIVEQVGMDGSFQYDHLEGRLINPGHGIEAIWFMLKEAKIREDKDLEREALTLLDWMWEWGWDNEYGGIIYFRDVLGKPSYEYWHDMKFWWPQTEAVLATLYAWQLSADQKYRQMFEEVYTYTMNHFPDRKGGEWYGYLHRDGRISTPLKGTMYKGPFHTPRMFLEGYEMLIKKIE